MFKTGKILFLLIIISLFSVQAFAKLDKRVSINLKNADIRDVFSLLAKEASFNIVLSKGIEGKVTLFLDNVTLANALTSITANTGLKYTLVDDIVYIKSPEQDKDSDEDVETLFYRPRFLRADQVSSLLTNYIGSPKGKIVQDNMTGIVIISEKKKHLDFMKNVLSKIDLKLRQVLIEAKIVELSKTGSRDLGIQWNTSINKASTSYDFPYSVSVGGGATGTTTTGTTSVTTGTSSTGTTSATSNSSGYIVNLPVANPAGALNLLLGNYSGSFLLDVKLQALEQQGDAKIVSEPKIVTVSNQKARIESGFEFRYKVTDKDDTSVEKDEAKLVLEVTPQITPENNIILTLFVDKSELDFSRTIDGYPLKFSRKASSYILLKDGETTVIGGLTQEKTSDSESSVPFLSKIPILGNLFKSNSKSSEINDLVIFLTPKIVDKEF